MGGIYRFVAGIQKLSLEFRQVGRFVVVTMDVSPPGLNGPHEVGAEPPPDFPNIPPHWLHLRSSLSLPEGTSIPSELGDGWRKWSRKHPKWRAVHGVAGWVAHVRSLLLVASEA
jgi:hypothetical protein